MYATAVTTCILQRWSHVCIRSVHMYTTAMSKGLLQQSTHVWYSCAHLYATAVLPCMLQQCPYVCCSSAHMYAKVCVAARRGAMDTAVNYSVPRLLGHSQRGYQGSIAALAIVSRQTVLLCCGRRAGMPDLMPHHGGCAVHRGQDDFSHIDGARVGGWHE